MYFLIGGDSEVGSATFSYLRDAGHAVQATTRRRERVSPERPFFDILHPFDELELPPSADAACIFISISRLRDCAADPVGSARINVTRTIELIDRLLSAGKYVVYLSTNQVFNGEVPDVPADTPPSPVSEYGRQKAETGKAVLARILQGAPIAVLRLSKVFAPDLPLIRQWIRDLSNGKRIQAFADMAVAPVPIELAASAIGLLLQHKAPGLFQLTGPRDVTYADIGRWIARELGVGSDLVEPVSAYSAGMPKGSTPRHTTLDCSLLREKFGIAVPDVWEVLRPILDRAKRTRGGAPMSEAKTIAPEDLTEVSEGVFYSHYPLPLIDAKVIELLKDAARRSRLRRARFCAHLTPDSPQHDMLIVSHRDTYVQPHRHLRKSETLLVLEGAAEMILFGPNGEVAKTVKMGTPGSGRPFFYRMPPGQFHSLAIESEVLVFVENTTGPFNPNDCELADWAPNSSDAERGKAFIASALRKAQ